VTFVQRRLEMLEQSAEQRAQTLMGDQQPLRRKVEQLTQQLAEERQLRERTI